MKRTVNATSDSVVCTLAEDELRDRARALRSGVFAAITAARETHDGFELAFPSGCGDMLCDFVAVESRCCSFVTFTIDDRDGQTWLGLSGPEGTKEFVLGWIPTRVQDAGQAHEAKGGSPNDDI